jgi:hypothetical protein
MPTQGRSATDAEVGSPRAAGFLRAGPVRRGPLRLRSAALALAIACAAACLVQPAAAQRGEPRVVVAPTILAEPASQTSLAIQVGPTAALPSDSFVRLRGLPASVSLTEGHLIAPGSWAVPLFALASLKAIVPAGVSGRSDILIQLVGVDGTTLAESRTALVVGPTIAAPAEKAPEPPFKRANPVPLPPPAAKLERGPLPQELTPEARARAEKLVANGERHFEQGNVGAARMFFQRAAEAGLAAGAIKMAATFDPTELARLDVVGVAPDRAEARRWYERARELGAPEAEDRLARIGRR